MKFIAEPTTLLIELEGFEVFFGLKKRLTIPRTSIVNLEWYQTYRLEQPIWRLADSSIPTVVYAGYFKGGGQRYYLYIR